MWWVVLPQYPPFARWLSPFIAPPTDFGHTQIINRDALLNVKLRLSLLPAPEIILTSFDQLQRAMINFPSAPDALDAHVEALEDLSTTITNAMQQHLVERETEPERPRPRGLLRRG